VVQSLNTISSNMSDIVSSISSSSALSASSLVGRTVLTDSSTAYYDGTNSVNAVVDAGDGADNITITITDSSGSVVGSYTADSGSGTMDFSWDGTDSDGNQLSAGQYTITATGTQNGETVSLPVSTYAVVGSVTLGTSASDTTLNLVGYGDVSLSDVTEISG
jgi:flagellar basal-body rod modification protein FlgD